MILIINLNHGFFIQFGGNLRMIHQTDFPLPAGRTATWPVSASFSAGLGLSWNRAEV